MIIEPTNTEISSPLLRFVLKYGIVIIVVVFYATAALHFDYTPDDTYIYLQYAKHVATGDGFVPDGREPGNGVTCPLWVLIIASGVVFGLDPYIVAKILDLVFASFSVLVLYVLSFAVIREKLYALMATWIFSFDAWFVRWASSGTETSLAILLTLLASLYAYKKEYVKAAVVVGALALVQPAGILLLPVVLLDLSLNGGERSIIKRSLSRVFAVFGGIIFVWLLFAFWQFGTIIPNTLQANLMLGWRFSIMLSGAISVLQIIGASQGVPAIVLVIAMLMLVWLRGWSMLKDDAILLVWAFVLPLAYAAVNVQVVARSLLPVLPVVVLYAIWIIRQFELQSMITPRAALLMVLIVAGLSLLQNQYVYHSNKLPGIVRFFPEVGISQPEPRSTIYKVAK